MDEGVIGTTRVAAVLGFPVHHSLSPAMQNAAFRNLGLNFVYIPFNVHPDNLKDAVEGIRALDMAGANITIPHKENVIGFLDFIDEDAVKIGSVNTILNDSGILRGYSTDGEGFMRALESSGKSASGSKTVLLGAGGSARAIAYSLAACGSSVTVANRTYRRAVELAESLNAAMGRSLIKALALESEDAAEAVRKSDLLINCTSVGMYPKVDEQPVPSEWLHKDLFVFDQIYNPLETKLLKAAKAAGAHTANGVRMLVYQGARSFEIWTGQQPSIKVMEEAVLEGLESS